MTVIEPGERQRGPNECRCKQCRCLFGYARSDMLPEPCPSPFGPDGDVAGRVACPNCGTPDTVILVTPESARREFPQTLMGLPVVVSDDVPSLKDGDIVIGRPGSVPNKEVKL